jgi:acyl carrier protein
MKADPGKVRAIVERALREAGDEAGFSDSDSLVVTDRLSSLDVVSVLVELEQAFDLQIQADEFDVLRFDSVESIVEMLEQARGH